jgi:hypothetical protein
LHKLGRWRIGRYSAMRIPLSIAHCAYFRLQLRKLLPDLDAAQPFEAGFPLGYRVEDTVKGPGAKKAVCAIQRKEEQCKFSL